MRFGLLDEELTEEDIETMNKENASETQVLPRARASWRGSATLPAWAHSMQCAGSLQRCLMRAA